MFITNELKCNRDLSESVRESHEKTLNSEKGDTARDGNDDSTVYTLTPRKTEDGQEEIITFLEIMVEDMAYQIPDMDEEHLPLFRKRDVFAVFVKESAMLHNVSPGFHRTSSLFGSIYAL